MAMPPLATPRRRLVTDGSLRSLTAGTAELSDRDHKADTPLPQAEQHGAGDSLFPERFVPGTTHGLIEAEHFARYSWATAWAARCDVLDAGCGVGYGLQLMQTAGAASLVGVDIAADAVAAARQRLGEHANIELADIAALPFKDDSFDLVLCFETIEHVVDQERALDELRRVLRRAGLLVISSPNPRVYPTGNPHHTHEYIPDELGRALSQRFVNVALASQHPWLASLICGPEELRSACVNRPLDATLHKIASLTPGEETFSLAIASDQALPAMSTLAIITTPDELGAWRRRALSAEEHLEGAREQIAVLRRCVGQTTRSTARMRTERDQALAALADVKQRDKQRELAIERLERMLAERNAALRISEKGRRCVETR